MDFEFHLAYLYLPLLLAAFIAVRAGLRRVTVFEHERGLKYRGGKFVGLLEPGVHWYTAFGAAVTKVDVRPRYETVGGQEVLSADNVGLKVSLAVKYQITDPYRAVNGVSDYREALYLEAQIALRDLVGATLIDEVLAKRAEIGARLFEIVVPKLEEFGIRLISVEVKDVIFPGELKKIFAQVVQAQKEGVAALERARGETAALRSLSNAARMVQDNPALLQLRLLQVLGETSGNTVVIGGAAPGSAITPSPSSRTDIRE